MILSYGKNDSHAERMLQKGFSLIELMLAVTIGALIIGASLYFATSYFEIAKRNATKTSLQSLNLLIMNFKNEKGRYPENLSELKKSGFLKGRDVPKDGWDHSFVYRVTEDGKHAYELFSYGSEGKGGPKEGRISVWD